jgi:hypothetical protein
MGARPAAMLPTPDSAKRGGARYSRRTSCASASSAGMRRAVILGANRLNRSSAGEVEPGDAGTSAKQRPSGQMPELSPQLIRCANGGWPWFGLGQHRPEWSPGLASPHGHSADVAALDDLAQVPHERRSRDPDHPVWHCCAGLVGQADRFRRLFVMLEQERGQARAVASSAFDSLQTTTLSPTASRTSAAHDRRQHLLRCSGRQSARLWVLERW